MANPCGQVHMPNFPCRECDRIRALEKGDADTFEERSGAAEDSLGRDGPSATRVRRGRGSVSSSSGSSGEAVSDTGPVDDSMAQRGKPDRLAVADEAVAETLARYRAKAAARQKRYRERMKARRAKIRGSPSE